VQSHVLIAEDEALVAEALSRVLTDAGYRVTVANDGLDALEAFEADPADLLWTDIRMPRLDGLELINRVRELNPALPVIIVSGHIRPGSVPQELSNAPTTVLMKPVSFQGLLDAVREALTVANRAVAA
jgi:DNA-binding NtrC family response regulator